MTALIIILIVIVVLALAGILLYNGLIRRRNQVENAWAQIDVQLKRRYDLIPNLVESVKGYAAHEKQAMEAVINARARAVSVSSDAAHAGQKAEAEGFLTQALGRLIAVAEAYPDLKANTNFMSLQEELASTENKIGFARQHFNDVVARYEEARHTFPSNIIASAFNFGGREYFRETNEAVREAPKVSFS